MKPYHRIVLQVFLPFRKSNCFWKFTNLRQCSREYCRAIEHFLNKWTFTPWESHFPHAFTWRLRFLLLNVANSQLVKRLYYTSVQCKRTFSYSPSLPQQLSFLPRGLRFGIRFDRRHAMCRRVCRAAPCNLYLRTRVLDGPTTCQRLLGEANKWNGQGMEENHVKCTI